MKRLYHNIIAFAMLFAFLLPTSVQAAELLIPGGQVIGVQLDTGTVTIAAFDDALGCTARDAGLRAGDEILSVNSQNVSSARQVQGILSGCSGPVELRICRDGKQRTLTITPRTTPEGPRLGVYLKQGIAGIGTVTWLDPATGVFGTLGHGVNDGKGRLISMQTGSAFRASVVSVKKGACGTPGQLKGCAEAGNICGTLLRNTPQGLFGIYQGHLGGNAVPAADYSEIHTGGAKIRSTVSGDSVQEYSVEILRIYPEDRADGRNFLLKVTDPELLSVTGGIVQGMSGSPILQDGKLVGAVTHVLVNDPTMGYGIFIDNMLAAAG